MSNIEWTQETWNPVVGCTRVSAGCDHCYAVKESYRQESVAKAAIEKGKDPGRSGNYIGLTVLNGRGDRHFNGVVRCVEESLDIPLRRKKPTVWFVNSMGDLFHRDVPFGFIMRVLSVTARTPQHTYQILTKRPERMSEFWSMWNDLSGEDLGSFKNARGPDAVRKAHPSGRGELFAQMLESMGDPPPGAAYPTFDWAEGMIGWGTSHFDNLWLGTSCEDQAAADERIPHLLRCPAAVRFLSCEPLLGGIDLRPAFLANKIMCPRCMPPGDPRCPYCDGIYAVGQGIDWVIAGGESGSGARPCDIAWIRSIVRQCKDAGVSVFVKQLGARPHAQEGVDFDRALTIDGAVAKGGYAGTRSVTVEGPKATVTMEIDRVHIGGDGFMGLQDRKGGDMGEWPEDLRVREMPVGEKAAGFGGGGQ